MKRVGGWAGVLMALGSVAFLPGCFGRAQVPVAQQGCTQEDVDFATSDSESGPPAYGTMMASIPVVTIGTLAGPANAGKVVFLDGVVQERHGCDPHGCPEDAPCQPCAPFLIVTDPPGVAAPRSLLLEIEPKSFMIGRMYRFLLILSDNYRERLGERMVTDGAPAMLVVCAGPR